MTFPAFPSIPRLSRDMIVTEKLDGTNASILIANAALEDEYPHAWRLLVNNDAGVWRIFAGSRTRWIRPGDDNYGFAQWVENNAQELSKLGEGHHFGEWWGAGIQRGYGLKERRFSLFNTHRWGKAEDRPACCHVVPVLARHTFSTDLVDRCLYGLKAGGSVAAPGFMNPEGVVVFHAKAKVLFKKTLDKNDDHKGVDAHGT